LIYIRENITKEKKMKASIWLGEDKFETKNVEIPKLKEDQVLVRVEKVGLCGTDVHITQGLFPSTPPKILGHEFSGVIVEVGSKIDKSNLDKRVACNTTSSCGKCENCLNWQISRCSNSVQSSGGFAEFSVMPLLSTIEIPKQMSFEVGAMTEPASCCFSGIEMIDYKNKPKILIIGAGIMGILCMLFAKQKDIDFIVVSEPNPVRRKMVKQLGADFVIDPTDKNSNKQLEELTHSIGFEICVEAVGKPNLLDYVISKLRPRGQALMIGVHPEKSNLPSDLYDFHYKEIKLFGAYGRGDYFNQTPERISNFGLDKLVSKIFSLNQINEALIATSKGEGMKYMISPNL
jgi:threonine dehydrogenase-like Zn-dependent dehydrogenase